ncbi:Protein rhomboid [Trachymyrmex cornetzi]|uniref:Protein rhomboid n=1 Tax=Trachymyrmex cornetzi TaxID=471704 RepID=A0A195EJ18_9HYME|nr:Protein rhomboid [Trachymyrmex cornetzi]
MHTRPARHCGVMRNGGGKPPPSSPCRLLPSQLRDGVLRSPANCHRGPSSVRSRQSRIGKSFAIPLATRRMDFPWIHKGITRERQTNIANYTRLCKGNYVRDCMPGNEFRYLPAQWNSFEQPSMSDYCVDSYHYCLINEYRSSPVEYIKSERDIKTAAVIRCNRIIGSRIRCTVSRLGFFTYYTVAMGEVNPSGPVPIDSVFIYRPDKRLELWRFAFYMFLHAGWLHLLFNLGVQVVVGLPLEMVHGSLRIAAVYMAGVLADMRMSTVKFPDMSWTRLVIFIVGQADCSELWSGRYTDRATRCNHKSSLGTSVFDTDVYLVGASGGVYALLAAHLANVLLNYNNMEFGIVRLIGIFVIASADVGFAIYDRYAAEQMGPPVSYVAHLTGALAGLTIGLLVLKNFEQRLHEQLLWWVALGVYAACTIFAIMYNLMHPDYP